MRKCCPSPAAAMKHRLTVQTASQVSDGQGGFTETWTDGTEVWASIEPVKGWERYQAMQTQAHVTHKIVMRYRTDVTAASRLKYGTRLFWVKEVINENEDGILLVLKAQERT